MTLATLVAVGVAYLLSLFGLATAVERGYLPRSLARHPLVSALALGVYATSWSYSGAVGFARTQGYLFLSVYLGVTLACLLVPVVWVPVLRLAGEHQLGSLADLFAFRYRGRYVGALVTLFLLGSSLPYLALQLRAVSDTISVLLGRDHPLGAGLATSAVLTVFTVLFGARHLSPRARHDGLVVAIAFESLVKLIALLAVAAFAGFGVLGPSGGPSAWVAAHPEALRALYAPVREGPMGTLLLLSMSAAFLLPRQYHMAFAESADERSLRTAGWALPLFLLLLCVGIPPILWAGGIVAPGANADTYVLRIAASAGSPWLPLLAFVGGLAAASGMMIVTALALASMCLNHLVLPLRRARPELDLYRVVRGSRRVLVAAILFSGLAFFLVMRGRGLAEIGLVSFVATAQFLPGLWGLLFWERATSAGFVWGLVGGIAVWSVTALPFLFGGPGGAVAGLDPWSLSTLSSLGLNAGVFVLVSLYGRRTAGDEEGARESRRDAFELPAAGLPAAGSAAEFRALLVPLVGSAAAEQEVRRALVELGLDEGEQRPGDLLRLRNRIERNLSGLLGPAVARVVVDEGLRMDPRARTALADHLRSLEEQLREARVPLLGAARELEQARRYFRRVLEELPLGVCVLGPDREITVWNLHLARLTGIGAGDAVGLPLARLPGPFGEAFRAAADAEGAHDAGEVWLRLGGERRCFALRRASLAEDEGARSPDGSDRAGRSGAHGGGAMVIVEELTEQRSLQARVTHQDRLASIGRFAAGVAHEVGNPLTGIASVAQNLRADPDPALVRERADLILDQIRRIDAIVRSLVRFSHAGGGLASDEDGRRRAERVPLHEVVDEAMRLVRLTHRRRAVSCENACAADLVVEGDRQQLGQVLVNLLSNACDASPDGGRVTVRGQVDGPLARLEVIDRGPGIPEEIRGRIFEPFVTTKAPGEGTGLGLSVVWSIVREHGGEVRVESAGGGAADDGTRVTVTLPRANMERST